MTTLNEAATAISSLEKVLLPRIEERNTSRRSRLPYKSMVIQQLMLWRIFNLSKATLDAIDRGQSVAGCILARAAIETAAMLHYLYTKIDAALAEKSVGEIDRVLMQLLVGGRIEGAPHSSVNVQTCIDSIAKKMGTPFIRQIYDQLCEVAHPNWYGTTFAYSTRIEEPAETLFSQVNENHKRLTDDAVSAVWTAATFGAGIAEVMDLVSARFMTLADSVHEDS